MPRVNVECPHCGQMFAQDLFLLIPGMWRDCPNCGGAIRYTARDIHHLWRELWRRRR